MNITRVETGALTGQIKMSFDETDYQDRVKKVLSDYRRKATIPGFRPGKVPMGMIKKMYGTPVLAEEVNKLLSEKLNSYITEEKLDILGYPIPSEDTPTLDFDNQSSFEFLLDVGYAPEVNIDFVDGMTFEYPKIKADNEMIDKHITSLREQFGEHEVTEVFAKGDLISGTCIEVDTEGVEIEGGISTEHSLPFGENSSVEEKFIGLKKEDTLTFIPSELFEDNLEEALKFVGATPENAEQMKNNFRFTVAEIKHLVPTEMNEAFFNKVYPDAKITTEEAFRAKEIEQAEKSFEQHTDMVFLNKAVEQIVENAELDLPDTFLRRWVESNMRQNSEEGTEYKPMTDDEYTSTATSFRWELLQAALMKKYDLKVEQEDVKRAIKLFFVRQYMPHISPEDIDQQMPQLDQLADSIFNDQEQYKRYFDMALNEKLIAGFKSSFTLDIKEMSVDEFTKENAPQEA